MSDEPPVKKMYKQRAMGFGKRRTEARTTALKLTTEMRPMKTVSQNQIQVSITRNEPAFSELDVTCRFVAKDLYQYRQVGTTKNWEDTLFTKSFAVVFHKALESLPVPEQGYAICLMDLAARSYGDLGSYDKFLGGQIRHKDIDYPICLPFLPIAQFNDRVLLEELKFLKSQDRFPKAIGSNEFEVDLCFVRKLTGSGLPRKRSIEKELKGVTPNNVSKFCLPVAILQGICWLEHDANKVWLEMSLNNQIQKDVETEEKWKAIRKISDTDPEYTKLEGRVENLLRAAGLIENGTLKERNYTIDDVKKIQNAYADKYQIVVFAEANNKKPVFCGPSLMGNSILPLLCKDEHYQHIHNLPQFVNHKYYCVDCKVGYGTLLSHYNCPLRCRLCNGWGCQQEEGVEITCDDCKVTFYSLKCEKKHRDYLEPGSKTTICGSTLHCSQCDCTYRKQKAHKCNHNYCQHCRVFRPQGHQCTMSAKNKAGIQAVPQKFIFVRVKYENITDDAGKRTQRALLAMALRCCKDCRDELETKIEQGMKLTCDKCSHGDNRLWFSNCFKDDVDVLGELTSFLISKEHEKYCIAFHDIPDCVNEHFLKYVATDGNLKARHFVMTEGRLRSVQFDGLKVKMIDSKYLFPLYLRKLAQSTDALQPFRYLPQSLIARENISFVGLVPSLEVFLEGIEDEEEMELIDRYHKKLAKHPYDMTSEILNCTYYELLLLAGSVRNIDVASFELLGVRLVEEVRDLPTGSLLAYQRSYLTDGILPLDIGAGSRFNNATSHSAREYLAWRSHDENLPIDSSFTVGEYRIKGSPYYVDGFIQPCEKYPRGLALEIHGCYWHAHGCSYVPKMVARRELDVPRIKSQDERKEAAVRELHDFEIIWECDIALLRTKNHVMEFMTNWEYEGPVEILASIYPPRAEVFAHFAEANEEYDLRICDITNLTAKILQEGEYPDVLVTRLHGLSFKVPIRTVEELRSQVKGIVYCEVLAPSSLMLPVLPDNVNDKVAYHLCKACFESETEICDHEEEERIQKGTWTTFELELALEQGYVITRVIGAIHCDKWSKYRVGGEEKHSIFSEYASVLRSMEKLGCEETGDAAKEPSEMIKNTTRSFLRLPERFGRRSDYPATHMANSSTDLWKLLENPMSLVKEIKPAHQNKLIISSGDRATVVDAAGERRNGAKPLDTTVTLVPALVGGQLRVEIYKAITQNQCHCLYLDDSHLVYLCPKGSDPLGTIGKDAYPAVKPSKYWSNGAGHFVVETEKKDLIVKTPGLTRKGEAFYARAEAIKRQSQLLIEGRPECVAIEHVAITHDTYNILTNTTATRLVHTTSPFSRIIQPDGSTLPKGFLW